MRLTGRTGTICVFRRHGLGRARVRTDSYAGQLPCFRNSLAGRKVAGESPWTREATGAPRPFSRA